MDYKTLAREILESIGGVDSLRNNTKRRKKGRTKLRPKKIKIKI